MSKALGTELEGGGGGPPRPPPPDAPPPPPLARELRAPLRLFDLQPRALRGRLDLRAAGEGPVVQRTVDAYVLDAALDPERVQPAQVVVGRAVALVGGEVDQVGPLHQAEPLERESHLRVALEA